MPRNKRPLLTQKQTCDLPRQFLHCRATIDFPDNAPCKLRVHPTHPASQQRKCYGVRHALLRCCRIVTPARQLNRAHSRGNRPAPPAFAGRTVARRALDRGAKSRLRAGRRGVETSPLPGEPPGAMGVESKIRRPIPVAILRQAQDEAAGRFWFLVALLNRRAVLVPGSVVKGSTIGF